MFAEFLISKKVSLKELAENAKKQGLAHNNTKLFQLSLQIELRLDSMEGDLIMREKFTGKKNIVQIIDESLSESYEIIKNNEIIIKRILNKIMSID